MIIEVNTATFKSPKYGVDEKNIKNHNNCMVATTESLFNISSLGFFFQKDLSDCDSFFEKLDKIDEEIEQGNKVILDVDSVIGKE